MILPVGERRRLRRMERSLASSDPRLVPLFSIFNRLTWLEAMPDSERLGAWEVRRKVRRRRAGGSDHPPWVIPGPRAGRHRGSGPPELGEY
jgi:hypothetical protein